MFSYQILQIEFCDLDIFLSIPTRKVCACYQPKFELYGELLFAGKSDSALDPAQSGMAKLAEKDGAISSKIILSGLAGLEEPSSSANIIASTRNISQSLITIPFAEQVEQLMAEIVAHIAEMPQDYKIIVFCPTSRYSGAC